MAGRTGPDCRFPRMRSAFAERIRAIEQIVDKWADYSIITVVCQVGEERPEGYLLVELLDTRESARHASVWLHLGRIRYLQADDVQEAEGLWVDEIWASVLPAQRSSWPPELREHQLRSWEGDWGEADLECEMVRVEIAGPWSMVAIAQIIDVSITPPALEGLSSAL